MDQEELNALKTWFAAYCASYSTSVREDQRNITIKQDHTREVCLNAVRISRELGLSEQEVMLADAIALFHDVGRFPQYREYKTFNDSISVNHAALGVKVLQEQGVLRNLPKDEQGLIVRAVALHNVFFIPDGLNEKLLLFTRLIRDADKLDIVRVLLGFFEQQEADRPTAVGLGLPDTPEYSADILEMLSRREMVRMSSLRTLNDFKLLQLAWLYDLNFRPSLGMIVERGTIRKLAESLPRTDEIARAIDVVSSYVNGRLGTQ